jgi:hypothetical protein
MGNNPEWLRLFALVSAEFAHIENCPVDPQMPSRHDRLKEIRSLDNSMNAVDYLENIKNATHFAENYEYDPGKFFLIYYAADRTVTVEAHDSPIAAAARLAHLESVIEKGGDAAAKVVQVEVDRIGRLIDTYPNYFGDVSLFVSNLRQICRGKDAIEYSMAPQQLVAPRPHEMPDPSLLRRRYTRWNDRR